MSRVAQPGQGTRGSLRWIQHFVNRRPETLDAALVAASGGRMEGPIQWLSPLATDDFAEYSDRTFLDLLGVELDRVPLQEFWPRRGPNWDGLARTVAGEPILVESKANLPEVASPPSQAGEASLARIRAALDRTRDFLGADLERDWTGTYYQYANRLAHLYLLHELNGVESWLVFLYFTGAEDVGGPASEAEWRPAIEEIHQALGLREHPLLERVVEVFVDVGPVT